jgi:hypothetical protein
LAPFSAVWRVGCQGFTEPNLFTLLNKNQTASIRKEYLICGVKVRNHFEKYKKTTFLTAESLAASA